MCLRKIHKKPRLLIFPKTVYKVIADYDGDFYTPYRDVPIKLGKTYTGEFVDNETLSDTIEYKYIGSGFIHSYISLERAKEEVSSWGYRNIKIIKCRIPAFTYYYKGKDKDIASRKLKYIKIID